MVVRPSALLRLSWRCANDDAMLPFLALMIVGTLCLGYSDVQRKAFLSRGSDDHVVLCLLFLGVGLVLGIASLIVGVPPIAPVFWTAALGTILLNLVSQDLFMRALALNDVSLIAPLRLVTPLLVIVTGFLFLREVPSVWGVVGITITVGGLYLLLSSAFSPRHLLRRGVVYGLVASVLFAFSFPLDKIAVASSSALFMTAFIFSAIGIVTACMQWGRDRSFPRRLAAAAVAEPGATASLIIVGSAGFLLTNQALTYTLVAYAASFKRLQAVWAILFARARLGERETVRRVAATAVIFGGIMMTIIAS